MAKRPTSQKPASPKPPARNPATPKPAARQIPNLPPNALTAALRTNYFPGRLLTDDDFNREQQYHRHHRYLHNLATLGVGVVSGLRVSTSRDGVHITPGLAIDPRGREIIVPSDQTIPWPSRPKPSTPTPSPKRRALFLLLAFREQPIDLIPATDSDALASAILETFELTLAPTKPTPPDPRLLLARITPPARSRP